MSAPIYIDGATGSNELEEPLRAMGLPVEKVHLEFGDVMFMGRGEKGAPLYIGIELKKLGELAQSFQTKRFQGHQLLGLTKDFDRRYLLVEGHFGHDSTGRATVFRGQRPKPLPAAGNAIAFEQEILNLTTRGGMWVVERHSRRDTLRFIQACYRYWTDKDLDEHKSHLAMYAPDLDRALLTPPTDFRKALTVLLPGVGFALSKAVEEHVGGPTVPLRLRIQRMLNMREADWAGLETVDRKGNRRRFGESNAGKVLARLDATG